MTGSASFAATSGARRWRALASLSIALVLFAVLAVVQADPAHAGRASDGVLLLYPCSDCHPIAEGSTPQLPNGFEGHKVVLEIHDALGTGSDACRVCHGDPAVDPGMLNTIGGGTVEITGDTSEVCFQCHSDIYHEFRDGAHGKDAETCTDAGCHDPHTPGYIYAEPLLPFVGSGFQFQVLPETVAFRALAGPPVPAPVYTPTWFLILIWVGMAAAAGQVFMLVRGGLSK